MSGIIAENKSEPQNSNQIGLMHDIAHSYSKSEGFE